MSDSAASGREPVVVTLDGTIRDADAPLLYADDLSALRGDGAFETLLVRGGRPRQIGAHLERLARSAAALELPEVEQDRWRTAIAVAAKAWGGIDEGAMRLVYGRGREGGGDPTAYVLVGPVSERITRVRDGGVSAMSLPRGYASDLTEQAPWLLLGAKTLSYAVNMAAVRYAEAHGVDEVIFTSADGYVLEGPRSTVVIARGEKLITPPPETGVLAGTTQRAVFAAAEAAGIECEYAPLRPADLIVADGVWMLSSVALAPRVHTLDGLELDPAPMAEQMAQLVQAGIDVGD